MSGLTIGLMSLDDLILEMKLASGTDEERKMARRVLPVITKHHLVLVTLLLNTVLCAETLPIFLEMMVPGWVAIIFSIIVLLIFGEVLPQAICTGPNQLKIAYNTVPIVKALMVIFFPICYPIAKLLDCLLGTHSKNRYKNNDLKILLDLHVRDKLGQVEEHDHDHSEVGGLVPGQMKMIHGAIDMKTSIVSEHMIPIENVYTISTNDVLDAPKFREIRESGFSRVPVYRGDDPKNLVGVLLIKKLIYVKPSKGKKLVETGVELRSPLVCSPNTLILDLLALFRGGKSHMAFVTHETEELGIAIRSKKDKPWNVNILGIITIEDILEELLKGEIYDEDDFDNITRDMVSEITRTRNHNVGRPLGLKSMAPLSNESMDFKSSTKVKPE